MCAGKMGPVVRYKLLEGGRRVGWKLVLGIEGGVRGNGNIAYRFTSRVSTGVPLQLETLGLAPAPATRRFASRRPR